MFGPARGGFMRWYGVATVCCLAGLLVSCGGIGLSHEERLVGDLGLVACDTREQMAVTDFRPESGGNLVPATVFAAGWDESHVIVKRHPREGFRTDRSRTEYYIVVVRDRKAHGPFDEADFALHCDLLGVAERLSFTRTFPDPE
jgi:hypothetical protein